MAFGSSLNQQTQPAANRSSDPIFLDIKEGNRVIRILGSEVVIKQHWVPVRVKTGNDIAMKERPITVGVLRNGKFEGHDGSYYTNNPIDAMLAKANEGKEQKDQKYARTRFFVNVLDRTPVIKKDGTVYYPDAMNKYAVEGVPAPHDTIMVLEGSAGKEGGKHLLQQIVTAASLLRSMKDGSALQPHQADLMIVTRGKGESTNRSVMPSFNQDEVPEYTLYDLETFCTPWPVDALQALIDGGEYNEIRARYNLLALPTKPSVLPAF